MKIALATTDGVLVDEHFGRAGLFAVYGISKDGYGFIEMRKFAEGRDSAIEETKGMGQVHEDRVEQKVEKLSDCKMIYFTEIGGPSAARLVKKGIMPMKINEAAPIEKVIEGLFNELVKSRIPWIRRALEE